MLTVAYKESYQGVYNLEHFRVKIPVASILYIASIMISGCEISDIVGNNSGALPYKRNEFTGKDYKYFMLQ